MEPRRTGPFPYTPINRRPKITWPDGKRLALWVIPNIEHFEFDEPFTGFGAAAGKVPDVYNGGSCCCLQCNKGAYRQLRHTAGSSQSFEERAHISH